LYNNIDIGGVIVRDVPTFRTDDMPYGGVKNSGIGKEGVRWAMHDMCYDKIMVVPND
jgi:acyl-CoA reductase-like NAD-dependent aldehyde dehydrogenase